MKKHSYKEIRSSRSWKALDIEYLEKMQKDIYTSCRSAKCDDGFFPDAASSYGKGQKEQKAAFSMETGDSSWKAKKCKGCMSMR